MAIIAADMTQLLQNIERHSLSIAGCKIGFKAARRNFIASSCSKASIGEHGHISCSATLAHGSQAAYRSLTEAALLFGW